MKAEHYTTMRSYKDVSMGLSYRASCSCGWKSAKLPREEAITAEFFHQSMEEKHAQAQEANAGAGAEDLR